MAYYVDFLANWECIFLLLSFVFLLIFLAQNWLTNVYAKQNKQLAIIRDKLISYPTQADSIMKQAPYCYQVQWHIFKRTNVDHPAIVFEFFKYAFSVKGIFLASVSTLISLAYFIGFCLDTTQVAYLLFFAFTLLFIVMVILVSLVFYTYRTRKAQRTFAEFLLELNKTIILPTKTTYNTVQKLTNLQRLEPTSSVMQRAAEILQQRGINSTRTTEEQRQINIAINGLLQAYSQKLAREQAL